MIRRLAGPVDLEQVRGLVSAPAGTHCHRADGAVLASPLARCGIVGPHGGVLCAAEDDVPAALADGCSWRDGGAA